MKLLLVITRAELGGAQSHVADLIAGLRNTVDMELATGETGYLTEFATQAGVKCHILPDLVQPMDPVRDIKAVAQCTRLIREIRPDLVHAHTSKAGVAARIAAKLTGVPAIFTAHTWCFAEGTSLKWRAIGTPLEWCAARWSAKIITVSESNRTVAMERGIGPASRFTTVHNGIGDIDGKQAVPGAPVEVPRIVMVSRFSAQKAHGQFIEALSGVSTPFELVLVGDGPTRAATEALAGQRKLGERVRFLGPRTDVPEILASSHLFVLSTNWEGFPISILEAMRAGLPVISHDVNGCRESVVDGVTGLLVPPGDTAQLRGAIEKLLTSPESRARMGAAGRRRFKEQFTVDAMLAKTIAVYRSASSGTRHVIGLRSAGTSPSKLEL
jgi:glycosyltransferase involved in cell wall biosynthesis